MNAVEERLRKEIRTLIHDNMHASSSGCCADVADKIAEMLDGYGMAPTCEDADGGPDGEVPCRAPAEEVCEGCDLRLCDRHLKHDVEAVPLCAACAKG